MAEKFKVGEEVEITTDPQGGEYDPTWVPGMDGYKGWRVFIREETPTGHWLLSDKYGNNICYTWATRWLSSIPNTFFGEDVDARLRRLRDENLQRVFGG